MVAVTEMVTLTYRSHASSTPSGGAPPESVVPSEQITFQLISLG